MNETKLKSFLRANQPTQKFIESSQLRELLTKYLDVILETFINSPSFRNAPIFPIFVFESQVVPHSQILLLDMQHQAVSYPDMVIALEIIGEKKAATEFV